MKLLENDRICLRPLEPEDLEFLYKWENDSSLWAMGTTLSPYSRYVLKEYIAESYKSIYETKQLRLMIVLREENKTIGIVDFYDFDPHNNRAGVGILLDADFHGKGYASDAINLLSAYAFSFLKLHQLYAHVPENNERSKVLFSGCGFIETGLLREWNSTSEGFRNVCVMQLINNKTY